MLFSDNLDKMRWQTNASMFDITSLNSILNILTDFQDPATSAASIKV